MLGARLFVDRWSPASQTTQLHGLAKAQQYFASASPVTLRETSDAETKILEILRVLDDL